MFDRLKRAWLALTIPDVTDEEEQEGWWREMAGIYAAENRNLRREKSVGSSISQSDRAARAWRENGRVRRVLKMCASQVVGADVGVTVSGDRRVGEYLQEMISTRLNSPPGSMVEGCEGFLLRVYRMYLDALRDGDLYVVLYPDSSGLVAVRTRPRYLMAYTQTDQEDWENELWYAEAQEQAPSDPSVRSDWQRTWDAPSASSLRVPEMLHYALDPVQGSTTGEGLAEVVRPWAEEYQKMLRDRSRVQGGLGKIQWLVSMPGTNFQTRAERAMALEAMDWGSGGYIVQDPRSEEWSAVEARSYGGDAEPDLRSVRDEAYISAGVVPLWSGDGGDMGRATSRTATPVAMAALRTDQASYFGFLRALFTRAVQKAALFRGWTLRPFAISVSSADTTTYENLEAARGLAQGAGALRDLREADLIEDDLARRLVRRFAGLPEELQQEGPVMHIMLGRNRDGMVEKQDGLGQRAGGNGHGSARVPELSDVG